MSVQQDTNSVIFLDNNHKRINKWKSENSLFTIYIMTRANCGASPMRIPAANNGNAYLNILQRYTIAGLTLMNLKNFGFITLFTSVLFFLKGIENPAYPGRGIRWVSKLSERAFALRARRALFNSFNSFWSALISWSNNLESSCSFIFFTV